MGTPIQDVVQANRQRELWLREMRDGRPTGNALHILKDWCDANSIAGGQAGGLDSVDERGVVRPEIYCYAPLGPEPNSEVHMIFVTIADLETYEEITEAEAKSLHPNLAKFLEEFPFEDMDAYCP